MIYAHVHKSHFAQSLLKVLSLLLIDLNINGILRGESE